MKKYFVLQVRASSEKKFIEKFYLLNDISKDECELLFPERQLTIRRQGQILKDLQPIFPGYIFLKVDDLTEELIALFRKMDGYIRFLPCTPNAKPLYGNDLDIVVSFTSFGQTLGVSKVYFNENDRIVVTEGPLLGFEGNIIKVDRRKKRVKIKLTFANNDFTVDLAFEDVGKKNSV